MKKIEAHYILEMKPTLDIGQFSAGKTVKIDAELYRSYIEARKQFEILGDEIFRLLPYKVKSDYIKMFQKETKQER